jgi:tetraacyldisaccharide 4'-kinase
VGNLKLGGTGKTPHTEYLIRLLKNDYRVATLSRGYGRRTKGFKLAETSSTYNDLGDEPLLYFKKFPGIQVAVDEDRVDGVTHLLWEQGVKIVLLDDAFQHRSISAGLNILLTEYQRLYMDDYLFPAGTLRDVRSAAKRADIIVISKAPKDLSKEEQQQITNKLNTSENQKVYFSYLEHAALQPLNEVAKAFSPEEADSAFAFCGIGNPKPFVEELKKRYHTVDFLPFGDHHAYKEKDMQAVLNWFEKLDGEKKIIVTTEKDAARLTNSPYFCQFERIPLYDLPVTVRFHEEEKFNEEILSYVRKNSHDHWLH